MRRQPRSTRTDTLLSYTTRFRSHADARWRLDAARPAESGAIGVRRASARTSGAAFAQGQGTASHSAAGAICAGSSALGGCHGIRSRPAPVDEIGRAHVCTPVTNAPLVCRPLLEKKKKTTTL